MNSQHFNFRFYKTERYILILFQSLTCTVALAASLSVSDRRFPVRMILTEFWINMTHICLNLSSVSTKTSRPIVGWKKFTIAAGRGKVGRRAWHVVFSTTDCKWNSRVEYQECDSWRNPIVTTVRNGSVQKDGSKSACHDYGNWMSYLETYRLITTERQST